MRIVLNIHPMEVTGEQVEQIRTAARGAQVEIVPPEGLDKVQPLGVQALVTASVPETIERWSDLKMLQLVSAGYDHLQSHPLWEREIAVTTAGGIHAVPMAQYVLCTTLMMARQMPQVLDFHHTRRWEDRNDWYFQAEVLRGKTAGILGYGAIGRETARLLSALGMHILCVDRNPRGSKPEQFCAWEGTGDPEGTLPDQWHGLDGLDQVLAQSDLIVVTLPHVPETHALIDWKRLRRMKPTAQMIIISRGGVVEETALASALEEGVVAGAAVDCFEEEPLPRTHALFDAPNIILTPHISGGFKDYWPTLCRLFCENLQRLYVGQPLLNQVNR